MHPYGVDNGREFISLYLNLSKPDIACSEVLVEVSLSIKDRKSALHKKLTGSHWYSKLIFRQDKFFSTCTSFYQVACSNDKKKYLKQVVGVAVYLS
jgi:hypothetical protein